jgi:hypothetical protein
MPETGREPIEVREIQLEIVDPTIPALDRAKVHYRNAQRLINSGLDQINLAKAELLSPIDGLYSKVYTDRLARKALKDRLGVAVAFEDKIRGSLRDLLRIS